MKEMDPIVDYNETIEEYPKRNKHLTVYVIVVICIALIALFSSCITQERCLARYPPTTIETVVYKDTTYIFYLPLETQFETIVIYDTITKELNIEDSYLVTEFCESSVRILSTGELEHLLYQLEVEKEVVIEKVHTETIKDIHHPPIRINYVTTWQRIRIRVSDAFLGFLGIAIGYGIIKRKLPFKLS